MQRRSKIILGALSGLLITLIGLVLIPVVNAIVKTEVNKQVTLVNGSYLYQVWKDPPMPIYLQIYMLDLVNTDEVKQGDKPYVVEKGPYTYREERNKFDVIFNDNGTISYRQKRLFTFIREMSVGDDEIDVMTTVNPALLALIEALDTLPEKAKQIIIDIVGLLEDIFITRSVRELVWGYVDPSLQLAHTLLPAFFYTDFIGYFMNKNNTDDGVYTIFSGADDISKLGIIDMYNGSRYLNFWSTPWANLINGSDGTINRPFLEDTKYLYFFSSDICRSAFGMYTSDIKIKDGIKLHRYTGTAEELANISVNPNNAGFCTKRSGCLGTGLLDMSVCTNVDYFPIPVVISFPHFYLADEKFVEAVEGIRPIKLEHETSVDVDPLTGLLLQAAKRLQINMHITHIEDVKMTHGIKPVVLPILWLNESTVVDDENANKLNNMLFIPIYIAQFVEIVLISIGGSILFLCVLIGCRFKYYKKVGNCAVNENSALLDNNKSTETPNTTDLQS